MGNKILAMLVVAILISCGVAAATHNPNNSKEVKEIAAAVIESPLHYYDTSALDSWCGEPCGGIRMIAGWYVQPDTIETEDGNWWSLNTESINPDECLLIWFDDKGTPEITDDEIIKVWSEVYD